MSYQINSYLDIKVHAGIEAARVMGLKPNDCSKFDQLVTGLLGLNLHTITVKH